MLKCSFFTSCTLTKPVIVHEHAAVLPAPDAITYNTRVAARAVMEIDSIVILCTFRTVSARPNTNG